MVTHVDWYFKRSGKNINNRSLTVSVAECLEAPCWKRGVAGSIPDGASIFIFKSFRLPPVSQSSVKHIQMKSSFKSNSWIMLYIYQYTLDDLIYVCPSLCPSVDAWLGKMVQSHNCSPLTPIIIKLLMSQGCALVI